MSPLELYNFLSSKYNNHIVDSICCVEKNCNKKGFCPNKQSFPVLDFDEIKNEVYHGMELQTPASVDAVCIGNLHKYFCFVELKGWQNYISFLSKQKKTIEETTNDYNLNGKLLDSQELCKQITSNPDLFAEIPTIFLLVTDIDVKSHGIEIFTDNMFKLASTSTDIYSQCVSTAKQTLDSEIHIDHVFIYCKNFDTSIANL